MLKAEYIPLIWNVFFQCCSLFPQREKLPWVPQSTSVWTSVHLLS